MPEISQQPEPVAESEPIAEPVAETESVAETVETDVPAPAPVADAVLLAAVDLARRALLEVTRPETVGSVVGHLVEDEHVLTLLFASDLSGYPGWHWSVTIARVEGAEHDRQEREDRDPDDADEHVRQDALGAVLGDGTGFAHLSRIGQRAARAVAAS